MSPNDTLFFAEMYSLVKKMEETIDQFDMKDRTLASIIIGVIDLDAIEYGDEEAEMKTMYSFNLQGREELNTLKQVMDSAYKGEDDIDLDDLLNGSGISLN
jgi:Zn-dependent M16 (insulinase) family peptidase